MDSPSHRTIWPRFTLLQLLVTIGIVSLACASFLAPNGFLAALWHVCVFAILASAIATAVYRRGDIRAFWGGFALFGWLFVASERAAMLDVDGVATVVMRETLLHESDNIYQRQAVQ